MLTERGGEQIEKYLFTEDAYKSDGVKDIIVVSGREEKDSSELGVTME